MKKGIKETFHNHLMDCVDIAKWSPSSHNSQPWFCLLVEGDAHKKQLFKLEVSNSFLEEPGYHVILLGVDRKRCLKSLMAHQHEMYLSLGAFCQVLLRLLHLTGCLIVEKQYYEKTPLLTWVDDTKEPRLAVIVKFNPDISKKSEQFTLQSLYTRFVDLVRARKTNRGHYLPLSFQDLNINNENVLQYAKLYDQQNNQIINFNQSWQIRTITDLVEQYAGLDFKHNQAWSETYRYIHFLSTNKPVGFSIESLFGPCSFIRRLGLAILFNPVVIFILNYFSFHQHIANQMAALVKNGNLCVGIVIDDNPSVKQTIIAGASVVDSWLAATANGLSYHPLSILLQHDHVRKQMEKRLGIKGQLVFIARVGLATSSFQNTSRVAKNQLLIKDTI
ncbi:nitroreductase family protein [Spartinivicinus ruber]|uniref:hypothetical protein n=1 Tax=Spartinivicinus ruber TaxID=2683272 RepID=UPI0013D064E7|nr:hypothetical protein [Spartinivicinus ruber]